MAEFGSEVIPGAYALLSCSTVDEYLERVRKDALGEDLPEGFVPSTTYWLMEDGEYIGHVNIRHRLTPALERLGAHIGYAIRPSWRGKGYGTQMLRMALEKARSLGVERVLITCDKDNIASRKVIEKNGGVFRDEIEVEGRSTPTLRFWIENR